MQTEALVSRYTVRDGWRFSIDRTIQLRKLTLPSIAERKTTGELASLGIGAASRTAAYDNRPMNRGRNGRIPVVIRRDALDNDATVSFYPAVISL